MKDAGLRFSIELPVAPERIFAAITEARHLRRWLCDGCESEARANGRLVLRWNRRGATPMAGTLGPGPAGSEPFVARWVEFTPPASPIAPARAAFQGGNSDYPQGDAGLVWFEVSPLPSAADETGARLEVRHEVPAREGYETQIAVWREAWPRALARLSKHLIDSPAPGS